MDQILPFLGDDSRSVGAILESRGSYSESSGSNSESSGSYSESSGIDSGSSGNDYGSSGNDSESSGWLHTLTYSINPLTHEHTRVSTERNLILAPAPVGRRPYFFANDRYSAVSLKPADGGAAVSPGRLTKSPPWNPHNVETPIFVNNEEDSSFRDRARNGKLRKAISILCLRAQPLSNNNARLLDSSRIHAFRNDPSFVPTIGFIIQHIGAFNISI
ncbi:hypothetical protein J6590_014572 [Homalodisca vitripennis]|nr:hypothetical protein J6590_014572 [Homalodisca vitripennis]